MQDQNDKLIFMVILILLQVGTLMMCLMSYFNLKEVMAEIEIQQIDWDRRDANNDIFYGKKECLK